MLKGVVHKWCHAVRKEALTERYSKEKPHYPDLDMHMRMDEEKYLLLIALLLLLIDRKDTQYQPWKRWNWTKDDTMACMAYKPSSSLGSSFVVVFLTWPTESGVAPPRTILLPQMLVMSVAIATTLLVKGRLRGDSWLADVDVWKTMTCININSEEVNKAKLNLTTRLQIAITI